MTGPGYKRGQRSNENESRIWYHFFAGGSCHPKDEGITSDSDHTRDQGIMDYSLDLRINNPDENPLVGCATEVFQLRKKSEVEADRAS